MQENAKQNYPWGILAFVVILLAVGIFLLTGNPFGNPLSVERQNYQCNQTAKTCYVELVTFNSSQANLKGHVVLKVYSNEGQSTKQSTKQSNEIIFPSTFNSGYSSFTYSLSSVENVAKIEIGLQTL